LNEILQQVLFWLCQLPLKFAPDSQQHQRGLRVKEDHSQTDKEPGKGSRWFVEL